MKGHTARTNKTFEDNQCRYNSSQDYRHVGVASWEECLDM